MSALGAAIQSFGAAIVLLQGISWSVVAPAIAGLPRGFAEHVLVNYASVEPQEAISCLNTGSVFCRERLREINAHLMIGNDRLVTTVREPAGEVVWSRRYGSRVYASRTNDNVLHRRLIGISNYFRQIKQMMEFRVYRFYNCWRLAMIDQLEVYMKRCCRVPHPVSLYKIESGLSQLVEVGFNVQEQISTFKSGKRIGAISGSLSPEQGGARRFFHVAAMSGSDLPQPNSGKCENYREKGECGSPESIDKLFVAVNEVKKPRTEEEKAIGGAIMLCLLGPGLISIGWVLIATRSPRCKKEHKRQDQDSTAD